jgi:hypothetical protein
MYSAIAASIGALMVYAGANEDLIVLYICGLMLFAVGIVTGNVIEQRAENRMTKLENEIKELSTNGKGNTL